MLDTGHWMLDAGYWIYYRIIQNLESGIQYLISLLLLPS